MEGRKGGLSNGLRILSDLCEFETDATLMCRVFPGSELTVIAESLDPDCRSE